MKSDFVIALTQLAAERNLPQGAVLSAIEAALASAYRKDNLAPGQNIAVRLNPRSGDLRVFVLMKVVESVEDPLTEIELGQAKGIRADTFLDDTIEIESMPYTAGRIAAQTAKQVVMQRLREAERALVFEEYASRADEVVTATIQRIEPHEVVVDLGRAEAVIPESEQVSTERYRPGQKLKVYISEVGRTSRGPEIIVSRAHKNLLRRLFEIEVPEIYNGIVEIKSIAREPGSRSKVAVLARQEGVDAVGACVGLRGIRIQNIVNELQGEKIDVVKWNHDPATFISNALNPSQVLKVELNLEKGEAVVVVQDQQLSLAIGRDGQNARLAAKLTGLNIDIVGSSESDLAKHGRTAVQSGPQTAEAPEEELASVATVSDLQGHPDETTVAEEPLGLEPVASSTTEVLDPEPVASSATEVLDLGEKAGKVAETQSDEVSHLSPEEELAELSLQEIQHEVGNDVVKEEAAMSVTADVWQIPASVVSSGSEIRFAEDIMVPRSSGGGGRKRGGGRAGDSKGKGKRAAERRRK
jgi:N utilization substance protein A